MSFILDISVFAARSIPRYGIRSLRSQLAQHQHQHATSTLLVRLKSDQARPPPVRPVQAMSKSVAQDNQNVRKRSSAKMDSTKKASLLLNSLRVASQPLKAKPVVRSARDVAPRPDPADVKKVLEEESTEERSYRVGKKILWPGMWTILALAGTYGSLAYLDVKAGIPSSDGSHLPERAQLPQTWYLTPTVIFEGAKAGWNELDNLTIGIAVATCAIHLLKRSPLSMWAKLIHTTGQAKWTAFTYPLVHSNWTHTVTNMAALVWLLPGVVRYFDGDLFHTAAFLVSAPLVTSYLVHFAYRLGISRSLAVSMGSSGSIAAVFGVYCVAYADEKMWLPPSLVFRLDAMYWAFLFASSQAYALAKTPSWGNRHVFLVRLVKFLLEWNRVDFIQVHLASIGLGAAYAYFDLKHHLWIPLVSEISARESYSEVQK